jgi:hypothetical protein
MLIIFELCRSQHLTFQVFITSFVSAYLHFHASNSQVPMIWVINKTINSLCIYIWFNQHIKEIVDEIVTHLCFNSNSSGAGCITTQWMIDEKDLLKWPFILYMGLWYCFCQKQILLKTMIIYWKINLQDRMRMVLIQSVATEATDWLKLLISSYWSYWLTASGSALY